MIGVITLSPTVMVQMDVGDNLESDILSSLEAVDKDEENIYNTNNKNEHKIVI